MKLKGKKTLAFSKMIWKNKTGVERSKIQNISIQVLDNHRVLVSVVGHSGLKKNIEYVQ